MKIKIACLTFMVAVAALCSPVCADSQRPSIYDKGKKVAAPEPAVVEQTGIKYTPLPENGVPVQSKVVFNNITRRSVIEYFGEKRIPLGISTPGVLIKVSSDNELMSARVGTDMIHLENKGLPPGQFAKITVTATHKDYEPLVQTFEVFITDGAAYPHVVATLDDLLSINELGLTKSYRQTADIDLKGLSKWEAIGGESTPFTGVYNGSGFKIKNMAVREIVGQYPGLFGTVYSKSARITGVNLEGTINSALYTNGWHGTIVGLLDGGTISNSSFTGNMTFGKGKMIIGGITADVINSGSIINCSYSGKIYSQNGDSSQIGGISGTLEGTMTGCSVSGQIISESQKANVGGLTGINFGTITDSVVKSEIGRYGPDGTVGGIAGENQKTIKDSAYNGNLYIKGDKNNSGGTVGYNSGEILGCSTKGTVKFLGDWNYIGGIAGRNQGTIKNSVAQALVDGLGYGCVAGGIAGENYTVVEFKPGSNPAPAVTLIENSGFSGSIKLTDEAGTVGGAAGRNLGVTALSDSVERSAQTSIIRVYVNASSIDGKKAGRIVAENRLDAGAGSKTSTLQVVLKDNIAYEKTLVNGKTIDTGTGGDSINGQSVSNEELFAFETNNKIEPKYFE